MMPVAVRRDAVQRLERQTRLDQPGDRPGDDPDLGEAPGERGLGQVARLARVTTDHRIGADDDDETSQAGELCRTGVADHAVTSAGRGALDTSGMLEPGSVTEGGR